MGVVAAVGWFRDDDNTNPSGTLLASSDCLPVHPFCSGLQGYAMSHGWEVRGVGYWEELEQLASEGWEPYAVAIIGDDTVYHLKRKLPSDAKAEYELACLQEQHSTLKTCVELLKLNPSPENPAWEIALRIASRKDGE